MPMHDPPADAPRKWTAFAVVLAGTFLANMTVFIVVVALPSIGSQLGASGAQQQLILAGYELVYAVGLISGGRLGDLHGPFRVFGTGMAVFTLASAGCALAPSAMLLVAARLVQGAGTALLVPQVYSLARSLFGDRERPRAFALIGVVMGAGVIAGQAAGGLLVTADPLGLGWRSVFWVNLPVGAAALAVLPAVASRTRRPVARTEADLPGMTLAGLALFLLVLPLVMGRDWSWPWWTAVMLLASVPLGWLFIRRQRRMEADGRSPLVPPSLMRRAGVGQGLAMIAVFNSGLTVFFWLLALYLQQSRGLDAAGTGLAMVPLALAFIAASLLAPCLFPGRSGRVVILGAVVTALGYAAVAAVPVPPMPVLGAILAVTGTGMGLAITPMLGIALHPVPERQAGAGAGLAATAQQMGAALGVCLFGLIFYGTPGTTATAFRVTVAALPATALAALLIARRLSGGRHRTKTLLRLAPDVRSGRLPQPARKGSPPDVPE